MITPAQDGIRLCLGVRNGVIRDVDIQSRRLVSATAPLLGRKPDQAARLVAQLFSLCKLAQGLSAAQAIEAITPDFVLSVPQQTARRFLLLGETVLEHGGRIALDWPSLMGQQPCLTAVKVLRRALGDLWRVLYPAGDWMVPGGGVLHIDQYGLHQRLSAIDDAFAALALPSGYTQNPGSPVAWLLSAGWGLDVSLGLTALPDLPLAELEARLAADDGRFLAQPDWQGQPFETGPLARKADHPAVAAVIARHGLGLAARFAARLAELLDAAREMRDLAAALCNDAKSVFPADLPPADGVGLAVTEAARGRLVHRVEVRGGLVARYQILAPTEWNFHPQGVLFQALAGQAAGNDPALLARLAVAALDPCVTCAIEVK